jgi:penicillin-binding protein 1A
MMEGVIQRGTGRGINLPVPVAGKTGTTNDAKDVWFIGFTSNIVAGCYIGYDQPRSLGSASGGGMCGPVFQAFMEEAVKKYGGTEFAVPPGGFFKKIDRFSGAPLPDDASGDFVVAEYFRNGQEDYIFAQAVIDGGFAMGENLPLFAAGESDGAEGGSTVTTATGETKVIPKKADFGTMSSGGLY